VQDYIRGIDAGVTGMAIGVPRDWFLDVCDAAVEDAMNAAVHALVADGARVVDIELPTTRVVSPIAIAMAIYLAETASLYEANSDLGDELGPDFRAFLDAAQFVPAVDYLKALRARHLIQRDFGAAFESVDVILVPGAICVAPRHDHYYCRVNDTDYEPATVLPRTTSIFNLAGIPTLTFPSGLSGDGLPVAVQVAAPPFREDLALRVGYAYQRLTNHHRRLPPSLN
jgi:Asp-tRNA(Asn)/Glu-tRNA(Gln) amidotransferase A subunit family amidase